MLPVLHLHAIDSTKVSVASNKVTSQPSGAVTLLIRLVIDQPLKIKRPDWAFHRRLMVNGVAWQEPPSARPAERSMIHIKSV